MGIAQWVIVVTPQHPACIGWGVINDQRKFSVEGYKPHHGDCMIGLFRVFDALQGMLKLVIWLECAY
jgi:hypothetical protein